VSIVNKRTEDPQYMEDARKLYGEKCVSTAKELLKKEASKGRWGNGHQVQSREAVTSVLIWLKQNQPTELADFEKEHPRGSPQNIAGVLGVLLWDIVEPDSDDLEWSKDSGHESGKIYRVKRS
jgi:hypothetical protein